MSRIDDLDKILSVIRDLSKNLAPISELELSEGIDIELDILVEYLEELSNRGFISYIGGTSYITLKGRMALENAKNEKPFQQELDDKRIRKIWSIMKIFAAVLNALAIIGIAIWAQQNSNSKADLEREFNLLKKKYQTEQINHTNQIDSLKAIIQKSNKTETQDENQKNTIN